MKSGGSGKEKIPWTDPPYVQVINRLATTKWYKLIMRGLARNLKEASSTHAAANTHGNDNELFVTALGF